MFHRLEVRLRRGTRRFHGVKHRREAGLVVAPRCRVVSAQLVGQTGVHVRFLAIGEQIDRPVTRRGV